MRSAISWFTIPVKDLERARNFYCKIFNFDEMPNLETPDGVCALFPCEEGGIGGSLNPFMKIEPAAPYTGVTIWLNAEPNLQAILDKVLPAGGKKIVQEATQISEYGTIAMFVDCEGNRIGLHSSN
jgi:predicted enzyme related to lactoylglutathione lyase